MGLIFVVVVPLFLVSSIIVPQPTVLWGLLLFVVVPLFLVSSIVVSQPTMLWAFYLFVVATTYAYRPRPQHQGGASADTQPSSHLESSRGCDDRWRCQHIPCASYVEITVVAVSYANMAQPEGAPSRFTPGTCRLRYLLDCPPLISKHCQKAPT